MFHFIDRLIEDLMKNRLHNQRNQIINKSLVVFTEKHPHVQTAELREKFENEADRIYAIVDRSILRDRIERASYGFWSIVVIAAILIGIFIPISNISLITLASPFVVAFVNYVVSIATISISYNQRVKGAMDSVIVSYEKSLPKQIATESPSVIVDFGMNKIELDTVNHAQKIHTNGIIELKCNGHKSNLNAQDIGQSEKKHVEEAWVKPKAKYQAKRFHQHTYFGSNSESLTPQPKSFSAERKQRRCSC